MQCSSIKITAMTLLSLMLGCNQNFMVPDTQNGSTRAINVILHSHPQNFVPKCIPADKEVQQNQWVCQMNHWHLQHTAKDTISPPSTLFSCSFSIQTSNPKTRHIHAAKSSKLGSRIPTLCPELKRYTCRFCILTMAGGVPEFMKFNICSGRS